MQLVSNQELAWVISYQPVIVSMASVAALSPSYPSTRDDSRRAAIMIRKFIQLHRPR